MNEVQKRIDFVKNELVPKILKSNDDLKNHELISTYVTQSTQLDGFMSAILTLDLVTEDKIIGVQIKNSIIVKLMKGNTQFRKSTKSYQQFSNEVYIYGKVIPEFKKVLLDAKVDTIIADEWIPRIFYADYNLYPSLSDGYESILAMENLKLKGYRNGPRLVLDEEHLTMMIKTIADYHSLTYAMRLQKNEKLTQLIDGLTPLPFQEPDGSKNLWGVLYGIALDRYFEYLDRSMQHNSDGEFMKQMEKFREKYQKHPMKLMDALRRDDPMYSVILHGDYNRNNVLFQYDAKTGYDNPKAMKMIDFQEVRYGSPAMDLSFFMYFNMCPDQHEALWDKLLKYYHSVLLENLSRILLVPKNDKLLKPYFYENFLKHFEQFGFYGVMISIHFLPWMMCPEKECDQLSSLFEEDMMSKEFYDFAMVAGGDEPNNRMAIIAKHAVKKGYSKVLDL